METYIKLYRRFQKWGWYDDPNTKAVFLDILLSANYEPSEYHGITIEAGQCVIGRKSLAKRLGLSERQVRTALEHLKSTNEIAIKSTNKFSVVTVVNWAKWQSGGSEPTNEPTNEIANERPTSDQQPTTSKEIKNKRNKDIGTRFVKPTLEEVQAYIDEKGYHFSAEKFMSSNESKGWVVGKSPMKDWKAACRTWELYEKERNPEKYRQVPDNFTGTRDGVKYLNGIRVSV